MLWNIKRVKFPEVYIPYRADASDILDILEFLTVLLCIPLSYQLSRYLLDTFDFPFYTMDFKLFIFRYFNYFNYSWHFNLTEFLIFSGIALISWHVLSHLTMMAKLPSNERYFTMIIHYIRGNFFVLIVLISSKYILNLTSIPVIFILTYTVLSFFLILTIRLFSIYKLKVCRARGNGLRHVLVIADGSYIKIIDKIINQKEWGFRIVSILSTSPAVKIKYGNSIPVYSDQGKLRSIIESDVIDEILYCRKNEDKNEIRQLAELCNEIGLVLRIQASRSDMDPVQIRLETINQKGKLPLVDIPSLRLPLEIKTMADFYLSIVAMILLSPVFLLIMIGIKLDSRGPVLFKQERIGLRGRKFNLYKFRTMVENAEELLDELKSSNEMDGPVFKIKRDPRITRLGRFLRKSGLDEFPQLINVVRGEMSLIGPRPPLESEVKQYESWHLRRLSVKPGITCTWQIMPERNDIQFEKWVRMDLNYIDNWSLKLDIQLFFKTIMAFVMAGGR